MFYRRPKSYTITLQRAHSLLKIPRDSSTSIGGEAAELVNVPSRDRIQEAFRAAAKRHHPDLAPSSNQSAIKRSKQTLGSTFQSISKADNTVTFRECHEARELLLIVGLLRSSQVYTPRNYTLHKEPTIKRLVQ